MKKFAFSLQRILGFKITMYEKERNTLAQLRAEKRALEKRKEDATWQMMNMDAKFRQKAAKDGVRLDEVRRLAFHRENADKLVKQLNGEIAHKDVEIEKQLEVVIELDREVKSLEKLREKQWDDYQRSEAREENQRILEIVSARFVNERAQKELGGHA